VSLWHPIKVRGIVVATTGEAASAFNAAPTDSLPAHLADRAFEAGFAASIFEHGNLSEGKAEGIWHHAYLSATKRGEIGAQLTPLGVGKVLYFGEEATWKTVASPSTSPFGIGGASDVVWHCDANLDQIYELSPTDFSAVRSASSPSTSPLGIGGASDVIWHCDSGVDLIYELSTIDLSVIRSAASPSTVPSGIGGASNVIWHCDANLDQIYELSPTDFSIVRGGEG